MRLVLIVALLLPVAPAYANLGETEMQVQSRFGWPAGARNGTTIYRKGTLQIAVIFSAGKSVQEEVRKISLSDPDDLVDLSDTEVHTLLSVYGTGQTWIEKEAGKVWMRADNKVVADVAGAPVRFIATDTAWAAAEDDRVQRDKATAVMAQKRAETQGIADAFGAIPPAALILTPTPRPGPTHLPNPPYPLQARAAHITGSGTARATFDASGHCSNVEIVQSAGSAILDMNTKSYGKANWVGPAGQTVTIPVTYRLQ